jgi:hypothetical protein
MQDGCKTAFLHPFEIWDSLMLRMDAKDAADAKDAKDAKDARKEAP